MNVIWLIRWERFKWIMRLGPLMRWRQRRNVRRVLLTTPGVDHLVRSVMDMRYGKYGWRVTNDMLEAEVASAGQGAPWWGPIGPLRSINTRKWLTSVWMEHKGLSHAKLDQKQTVRMPVEGHYETHYLDTHPLDERDE